MKKIISILLMIVLLSGCLSIAAHAEQSKIDPALAEEIERLDEGETLTVAVWTVIPGNFKSSFELTEYVNQKTHEEIGLTPGGCTTQEQVDTYSRVYNRIMFELERANVPVVIEKLGLGDEDIIGRACNMLMAYLTKDQIAAAAQMDEVRYIERYEVRDPGEPIADGPYEPLDPDDLKAAFAEWLFSVGRIGPFDPEDIPDRVALLGDYQVLYADDRMVLIDARIYESVICPWEQEYNLEIGGRVIPGITGACDESSAYPYYIYDKVSGEFKNIFDLTSEDACYARLEKALEGLKIGRPIGDADGDGALTVLDATFIRRCLVGLDEPDEEVDLYQIGGMNGAWKRYSDADGDGSITILDATLIQRCLAGLCEIVPMKLSTRLPDGIYTDEKTGARYQVISGIRYEIEDPVV